MSHIYKNKYDKNNMNLISIPNICDYVTNKIIITDTTDMTTKYFGHKSLLYNILSVSILCISALKLVKYNILFYFLILGIINGCFVINENPSKYFICIITSPPK
jgi:hypothetical protein